MFTNDEHEEYVNTTQMKENDHITMQDTVQIALDKLHEGTGLEVANLDWQDNVNGRNQAIARLTWVHHLPDYSIQFKPFVTKETLGPTLEQYRRLHPPALLVIRHVNPIMARRLKAEQVQFIDAAGNACLEHDEPLVRVWIEGKKVSGNMVRVRTQRAFRATGLRVIFPLLCLPEAVAAPYRTLAAYAGVALGAVAHTMNELRRLEYVREGRQGRMLQNREKLIDAWVDAYARELRPVLQPHTYRVSDPDWWREIDLGRYEMLLGGESAAALLTEHLRPGGATIYGTEGFRDCARDIRAVHADTGTLVVMKRFWNFTTTPLIKRADIVPALLVYAELVVTADARNLETAAIIREKFLA